MAAVSSLMYRRFPTRSVMRPLLVNVKDALHHRRGARGHVKDALHRSLPAVEPAVGYGKPMSFVAVPPAVSENGPTTLVAAPKTASTEYLPAAVASAANTSGAGALT